MSLLAYPNLTESFSTDHLGRAHRSRKPKELACSNEMACDYTELPVDVHFPDLVIHGRAGLSEHQERPCHHDRI
jgi:hypothetical protein